MKHLETLNTSPHPGFKDINDLELTTYLATNFEIEIKNIVYIKDIINMFSHEFLGFTAVEAFKTSCDDTVFKTMSSVNIQIPVDYDILNAAVALYLKLFYNATLGFKQEIGIKNIDIEDIDSIFRFDMVSISTVKDNGKMSNVSDVLKIPYIYKVFPDFNMKFLTKKYIIPTQVEKEVMKGSLYIDYSMSMFKYRNLLYKLVDNLRGKEFKLVIFKVIKHSIIKVATVTSIDEYILIINTLQTSYVAGKLNYLDLLEYDSFIDSNSTLITDAKDFDIPTFLKKANNFNLVTINNNGKFKKYKT